MQYDAFFACYLWMPTVSLRPLQHTCISIRGHHIIQRHGCQQRTALCVCKDTIFARRMHCRLHRYHRYSLSSMSPVLMTTFCHAFTEDTPSMISPSSSCTYKVVSAGCVLSVRIIREGCVLEVEGAIAISLLPTATSVPPVHRKAAIIIQCPVAAAFRPQ